MLRRESGQILPGLIMLMLAILALGMLTFRIGRAAVLRSDAQTAADAAALAAAGSVRDQLIAQVVATGTSDFNGVSRPVVEAAARDYAKRNDARLTDLKIDGADVRAFVDTNDEKVDPPKDQRRGVARARARVELADFASLGGASPIDPGAVGPIGGDTKITDKEWKDVGKDLHDPPGCADVAKLGAFLKKHGAIPPYENASMGTPPMPAGGERTTASYHYKCGQSGAIDLNYPQGIEASVIDQVLPHVQALGFRTFWQVANHFDHMHIDYGNSPSLSGGPAGAAGTLQDSFLEVKLIDWNAPSADGLGLNFVGGAGGIPFGPPDPQVAAAMCTVMKQMHVSAKVRLAAWETAIVESGVK
ncbi:MAG: pilus assembly protein TadG-related protein, partial [Actinomycetota bacterium]|nr:pilus assembly protein TadG-related protein [Actinomycetota bacterium]